MKGYFKLFSAIFILSFCMSYLYIQGQNPKRCIFDREMIYDTYQKKEQIQFEDAIKKYRDSQSILQKKNSPGVKSKYKIPLIFHIIHTGEEIGKKTNLSSEQIYSQISVLNIDFNQKNIDDQINILPNFSSIIGNAQIDFLPATIAPDGSLLPEAGIHRVRMSNSGWTHSDFRREIASKTIWNPQNYCNVWIFDVLELFLGWAQYPSQSKLPGIAFRSGSESTDGILVDYTTLGHPPANSFKSVYNRGRTLVHEMGHWLGLLHPWGRKRGCTEEDGDFCDDTPLMDSPVLNCPKEPVFSCGSLDMTQNFMTYVDDVCMYLFTQDQVERMHAVMEIGRNRASLSSSPVLSEEVMYGTFFSNRQEVCIGSKTIFRSYVFSSEKNIKLSWYFKDGTPEISNQSSPTVSYNSEGYYDVRLIICHSEGNDTVVKKNYIHAIEYQSSSSPIPFKENFEKDINWTGEEKYWQIVNIQRKKTIQSSVVISNFSPENNKEEYTLFSPILSVPSREILLLNLDFMHVLKGNKNKVDSLKIAIKDICADTLMHSWNFSTIHYSATQWENLSLSFETVEVNYIQIMIGNVGMEESKLYIDNLSVRKPAKENLGKIHIFPNPASSFVHIHAAFSEIILEVEVYNSSGVFIQKLQSASDKQLIWDTRGYRSGLYILKAITERGIYSQKLLIHK